jgi:antitoxin component YwqK of YwqJK toxin-antitoxin module
MSEDNTTAPRTLGHWRRFLQFRLRTLLLLTFAAAVAMFFYTRPEVMEEQPLSGYRLKRQVYRTEDGKPVNHGWWELRDSEGHVICEGRYRNDQPSGEWVWRHPSGQPRQQGEYRQGQRHGIWKTWHADGQPQEEWTYADGTLHGPARTWFASGQLASEGQYAAGRRSGEWNFFHEDGEWAASGSYENDVKQRDWLAWDSSGRALPTQHYVDGRLVPDDKALVEAWCQRLHSGQFAKQAEAAWALARLGEPGLVVLDKAAAAGDDKLRSLALIQLAKNESWAKANVPRLIAALDLNSWQVRLAVMLPLSALGPQAASAAEKLEQLLNAGQEDGLFQDCLLATLVSIAPERNDLVARFVVSCQSLAFNGPTLVSRYLQRSAESGLLHAVKAGASDVRVAAMATLVTAMQTGRFSVSAQALQVFAEALGDPDGMVREQACEHIAILGPAARELKPHLQKAANDPTPAVAQAARNAIQSVEVSGPQFGGGFF